MELPIINRFSGLDSGITSLPNPTFLSQIFASFSGVQSLSQSLDFWKWSAVIIAVVATFSGVINRVRILFVVFKRQKCVLQDIDESGDEFSDDETASSVSSSESDFEEDDEPTTSSPAWDVSDRDFHVRGSDYFIDDYRRKRTLRLRQRRSLQNRDGDGEQISRTDFGGGRSVVKLWDNLRLEFDSCEPDANEIRLYDVIKDQKISSIFAGNSSSSTLLLSAGTDVLGKMSLNLWDTRVGFTFPAAAIIAEWKPLSGKVDGIRIVGDQKVYFKDEDAGKITVGDVRNVRSPVENLMAADVETWWDADAVLVSSE